MGAGLDGPYFNQVDHVAGRFELCGLLCGERQGFVVTAGVEEQRQRRRLQAVGHVSQTAGGPVGDASAKHIQPGQWVYAGDKSNKGIFLGIKKSGTVVVAWYGNAKNAKCFREYIKTLHTYAALNF
jgi:hypothetical protein